MRLHGIRHWIEQSYKQVKTEPGWADFQVRSATAIRRLQTLVNCAFSFCWNTWFTGPSEPDTTEPAPSAYPGDRGPQPPSTPRHPSRPTASRAVRSRLAPWIILRRLWNAWTTMPPPPDLQLLLNSVAQGRALNLYTPP